MFLKKFRNIFCCSNAKTVSVRNVSSARKQGKHSRPCYTRQFFLQLSVARQVARKISRVTPQFCNLQRQQNVALRVARKVEISCVWHVHRNLQGNFVKIRQSAPVFCSQEISSWRRKSCKQFPLTGGVASCEKILRTCDTPSATCNVFQSSSFRDKLQEKLPRVTWPYVSATNRMFPQQSVFVFWGLNTDVLISVRPGQDIDWSVASQNAAMFAWSRKGNRGPFAVGSKTSLLSHQ